jgi:hypothetical protein
MKIVNKIQVDNAEILFRNFAGKEGDFNPAGRRNFCVLFDEETATKLMEDGWNVRWLKPRDEDARPQAYIQVEVSWKNIPPKEVMLISSRGKTLLKEEDVNILDWVETEKIDLLIRPYNWDVKGKSGVKAYLESIYVTIIENELEMRYRDVPDSAAERIGGCGNCDACDGSCKE